MNSLIDFITDAINPESTEITRTKPYENYIENSKVLISDEYIQNPNSFRSNLTGESVSGELKREPHGDEETANAHTMHTDCSFNKIKGDKLVTIPAIEIERQNTDCSSNLISKGVYFDVVVEEFPQELVKDFSQNSKVNNRNKCLGVDFEPAPISVIKKCINNNLDRAKYKESVHSLNIQTIQKPTKSESSHKCFPGIKVNVYVRDDCDGEKVRVPDSFISVNKNEFDLIQIAFPASAIYSTSNMYKTASQNGSNQQLEDTEIDKKQSTTDNLEAEPTQSENDQLESKKSRSDSPAIKVNLFLEDGIDGPRMQVSDSDFQVKHAENGQIALVIPTSIALMTPPGSQSPIYNKTPDENINSEGQLSRPVSPGLNFKVFIKNGPDGVKTKISDSDVIIQEDEISGKLHVSFPTSSKGLSGSNSPTVNLPSTDIIPEEESKEQIEIADVRIQELEGKPEIGDHQLSEETSMAILTGDVLERHISEHSNLETSSAHYNDAPLHMEANLNFAQVNNLTSTGFDLKVVVNSGIAGVQTERSDAPLNIQENGSDGKLQINIPISLHLNPDNQSAQYVRLLEDKDSQPAIDIMPRETHFDPAEGIKAETQAAPDEGLNLKLGLAVSVNSEPSTKTEPNQLMGLVTSDGASNKEDSSDFDEEIEHNIRVLSKDIAKSAIDHARTEQEMINRIFEYLRETPDLKSTPSDVTSGSKSVSATELYPEVVTNAVSTKPPNGDLVSSILLPALTETKNDLVLESEPSINPINSLASGLSLAMDIKNTHEGLTAEFDVISGSVPDIASLADATDRGNLEIVLENNLDELNIGSSDLASTIALASKTDTQNVNVEIKIKKTAEVSNGTLMDESETDNFTMTMNQRSDSQDLGLAIEIKQASDDIKARSSIIGVNSESCSHEIDVNPSKRGRQKPCKKHHHHRHRSVRSQSKEVIGSLRTADTWIPKLNKYSSNLYKNITLLDALNISSTLLRYYVGHLRNVNVSNASKETGSQ